MRVLGISGSLRSGSHNTNLLRVAAQVVSPPHELEIFNGLRNVPPYDADEDTDPAPEAVQRLRDAIAKADALRNQPVAVIGASTGMFGAVWAQAEARKVLGATGARVVDVELPVPHAEAAFAGDRLADDEVHENLAGIVNELIAAAEARPAELSAAA